MRPHSYVPTHVQYEYKHGSSTHRKFTECTARQYNYVKRDAIACCIRTMNSIRRVPERTLGTSGATVDVGEKLASDLQDGSVRERVCGIALGWPQPVKLVVGASPCRGRRDKRCLRSACAHLRRTLRSQISRLTSYSSSYIDCNLHTTYKHTHPRCCDPQWRLLSEPCSGHVHRLGL